MKTNLLIYIFLFLFTFTLFSQENKYDRICVSDDENRLVSMINNFRKQNKLSQLPLSVSLTYVAKTHIADLHVNRPDTSICSTASWSNKGNWTACCYNPYVLKEECMWSKPKELTEYPYRGYELSYYEESKINVDSLFNLWITTPEAENLILSKGKYKDKKWGTFGLAVGDHYASVWFAQRIDPKGKPKLCSEIRDVTKQNTAEDNSTTNVEAKGKFKYHVIIGSSDKKSDAEEAIRRLKKEGFNNASILFKDKKIRISLNNFDNINEANSLKEKVKETYPDVWILKEETK